LDSLVNAHHIERYGTTSTRHGFLRDLNKAEYEQTRRDIRMIELFMFIAIMLSCLAFLAMSVQYAGKNKSTIAVHKVFGSSTGNELMRNIGVYFKIIGVAILVGLPFAVWISGRYLEQFAYRFSLSEKWWVFPLAILISLSISTLTVLWQTLRAARTNPAEVLKKE
jgi:putative ABC transport system permease protein